MRKYDKKVEAELDRLCHRFSGEFVQPILVDYPERDARQTLLFDFLSSYGRKKLADLRKQNLIDIPSTEVKSSIKDPRAGKVYRCMVAVETYMFPCKDVKVIICWDYGFIATKKWLGFPLKWVHFSRYRLGVLHSDGELADTDDITYEQLGTLLESVRADLKRRTNEVSEMHRKELESVLTKAGDEQHS